MAPEEQTKEPKEKKGKKKEKEAKPEEKKSAKEKGLKPDFKYIVRLVNTDISGLKSVLMGLTQIKGIGIRTAHSILNTTTLPKFEKIGNLSDEQITMLEEAIQNYCRNGPEWALNRQRDFATGESFHLLGTDLDLGKLEDINMLKMIRCYRGVRHEKGKKVRGQRTANHGRKGITVGVTKKPGAKTTQPGTQTPEKK
ncbi:MAG: 30S ribosomal protein S13 [Thermoplasmata archaeon]|nr:30S ribosomal protein S13 [Thermoplasmata archaeon]